MDVWGVADDAGLQTARYATLSRGRFRSTKSKAAIAIRQPRHQDAAYRRDYLALQRRYRNLAPQDIRHLAGGNRCGLGVLCRRAPSVEEPIA